MIFLIIFCTLVFLLKLLVDYVYSKSGIISVATIKGCMVGFDIEEVIMDYENPDTKQVIDVMQTSIEISLFFISIIFMYQQDLPEDDDYVY